MSHDAEHLFPAFGRLDDDRPWSRHIVEQSAVLARSDSFTRARVLYQVCL